MKKTISFTLSKNGKAIGQVHWEREFYHQRGFELPVRQSGCLKGDTAAVVMLQDAIDVAIEQEYEELSPLPCGGYAISDPLAFDTEMVSVFYHAKFDIPPEFDEIEESMKRPANAHKGIRY